MKIDTDIKTTIGRLITGAQSNTQLQEARAELLDRYYAEPYGDESEKRSHFVSSDVSDAVESVLPDILDVFVSSENVVEFLPVSQEDEEHAKQETDAVNHVFWKMNDGFLILLTLIRESLTQQNSYTKQGWVEKERVSIDDYEDLTIEELYKIFGDIGDAEYKVLEKKGFEIVDTPQGKTLQPVLDKSGQIPEISVKIKSVHTEKKYEIINIPQEDFFLSADWHSVSLDGVPVCGHRTEIEVGELRKMGFAEDSISEVSDEVDDEQKTRRHNTADNPSESDPDDDSDATRKVIVYESYVRADIDGDGKAVLCKVWSHGTGDKILRWENGDDAVEEVSDHPFSCVTPFIMPHRHNGRSLGELVTDIARVKTVAIRHTLDGVATTLYSRPMFNGALPGAQNLLESYLNPDHGSPIDTNGIQVEWTQPPQVIGATLPILQVMDELAERRTGSVKYAQGMATESLNNVASGTVSQVRDWVNQKKMVIARSMAETGLKDIFRRIHKDLRSGPYREMVMRLRNQWVPVNPREWMYRNDITVSVGMGTGDRDTIREGMMLVGQAQEKAMAAGLPGIGPEQLRNTAEKMMGTYGIEDIGPYWADPATIPPQPPQPDPQAEAMQAQVEAIRAQTQNAQQETANRANKIQSDAALEKYKIDLENDRDMAKLGIQQSTAQANYDVAMERLAMERQKIVMGDDFDRDELEVNAATGYLREGVALVNSEPPIDYGRVLGPQSPGHNR